MPRPRRAQQLTETMRVRMTPTERAELSAAAATAGMTVSEYVRRRSLGRRVLAPRALTDTQTLNELRRLGGLVKHLALSGLGDAASLRAALGELREAAARIVT